MHCSECGKEIASASKFCVHCGAPLEFVATGETLAATTEPVLKVELDQPPTPATGGTNLRCPKCGATACKCSKRMSWVAVALAVVGVPLLAFGIFGVMYSVINPIARGDLVGWLVALAAVGVGSVICWTSWAARSRVWRCQSCGYDWLDKGSPDGGR